MLDIKKIEMDFENVKATLSNRNFDTSILEEILKLNKKRKELTTSSETKKADVNKLSREIGELKKNKQDADSQMKQVAHLKTKFEIGHGHANALVAVFRKENGL